MNDKSYRPPFTHIIIDEAQDLSKAELRLLSLLVNPETNSITILAEYSFKSEKINTSFFKFYKKVIKNGLKLEIDV